MSTVITVVTCLLGSAGIFSFIQFLITRRDKREEKLDKITDQIAQLQQDVHKLALKEDVRKLAEKVETKDEEIRGELLHNQAVTARVRILRASDEILHKMKHSKEWFDQLNDDISFYQKYCEDHPKFVNNKAIHAIANIDEVYAKALKDNDFL